MTEAKKEPGTQFGVSLGERSSAFLGALFKKFHFSFQQKKQLAEFASDFEAWDETPVYELLANEQCGLNFNAMGASVSDILSADTQSPIGAKIEKENHGDKADVNGIQGGVCEQADNTYGDTSETCRSERSQTGEIYYGEKAEAHYDKQIPSSHDGQNGKIARYGKQNDKLCDGGQSEAVQKPHFSKADETAKARRAAADETAEAHGAETCKIPKLQRSKEVRDDTNFKKPVKEDMCNDKNDRAWTIYRRLNRSKEACNDGKDESGETESEKICGDARDGAAKLRDGEKTANSKSPDRKKDKAGKTPSGEKIFNFVREAWLDLKSRPHSYASFKSDYEPKKFEISSFRADRIALGRCPVASENTRCCNLLTLDAVNSCGFDCSYCAIGSFYKHGKIGFDENFAANLARLRLDPARSYHIGTGQSSDSLMWGDRFGILSALCDFAARHQNVILELKSKSNNIRFFLQREIPRNLIVTFSLNTPAIIANEEHLSASLDARLAAAEALAVRGILVGFHLHPMVWYEEWQSDYGALFEQLLHRFDPSGVAMVSLGTLTFIKPVVKKLRSRGLRSKILQMPLADANGKLSYPLHIKRELFKFVADALLPWRERVFFYLCMEDASLWREVLGHEYESNDAFEEAMKAAYFAKIRRR